MKHRMLLSFASLIALILISTAVTQVVQAASYYWRFTTPLPTVTCATKSGIIYITANNLSGEWSLPPGAMRETTETTNGVVAYHVTDTAFAGSTASYTVIGYNAAGSVYPVTDVWQIDTIVDGKAVYRTILTYNCSGDGPGTATIDNIDLTATCLALPEGSVVGNMPAQTQAYWAPGKVSPGVFINSGTYWVIGEDDTHQYYEIVLSCQFLWVPIDSMQPSYQAPWSGQPLPTRVVS